MTKAEKCFANPKIKKSLDFYACKLVRNMPYSMEFEDARQELSIKLLEKLKKYKSKQSALQTYACWVFRTSVANITRTPLRTPIWGLPGLRREQPTASYESLAYYLTDRKTNNQVDRIIDRLACDQIESRLDGMSKRIFSILRQGITQSKCADILNVNRSYVSQLLKTKIKPILKKYA